MKPYQQPIVEAIEAHLKKGHKRRHMLTLICTEFNITTGMFNRLLKHARQLQSQYRQTYTLQLFAPPDTPANNTVMDNTERQQILTQIARGQLTLQKPVVINKAVEMVNVTPDYTDRKNAIAELNKMDGTYRHSKKPHRERTIVIRPQNPFDDI